MRDQRDTRPICLGQSGCADDHSTPSRLRLRVRAGTVYLLSFHFFCAAASSKSVGGLPATVLLRGAESSNACLQAFVPEAVVLTC